MSHMSNLYFIFYCYKLELALLVVAVLFMRLIWPTTLIKNLCTRFGTQRIQSRSLSPYLGYKEEGQSSTDAVIHGQESTTVRQPYDVFLVMDVEATCVEGSSFNYPNEIIASIT